MHKLKVSIFGAGYVGLVLGFCLAKLGHEIFITDRDESKIALLKKGELPIYEPGLDAIFNKNLGIQFTSHFAEAIAHGDFIFISVNSAESVFQVATEIAERIQTAKVIVIKSTVPPGTALRVKEIISHHQNISIPFEVVSNPEFLREGSAIADFMRPARIIIGTEQKKVVEKMRDLYAPILANGVLFISMSHSSAELCKYAANAFLAMKIGFINEMSRLCETFGTDIVDIQKGMGSDPRIGSEFLESGCGYGGSCFPKDVQDLEHLANSQNCELPIIKAIETSNEIQKRMLFDKLWDFFEGDLRDRRIAVWGASFKPNTDDIRNAPSCALLEKLWHAGAVAQVYDPCADAKLRVAYPNEKKLMICDNRYSALENADALVLVTEWEEFKRVDFTRVRETLNFPLVLDGRNMFRPADWQACGVTYCGMGRSTISKSAVKV